MVSSWMVPVTGSGTACALWLPPDCRPLALRLLFFFLPATVVAAAFLTLATAACMAGAACLLYKTNELKLTKSYKKLFLTVDGSVLIGTSIRSTSIFVSVRVRLARLEPLSPFPLPPMVVVFSDALLLVLELMLEPGAEVFFNGRADKTCCTIDAFLSVDDDDGIGLWMRSCLLLMLFWKSLSTARNFVSIISDKTWP